MQNTTETHVQDYSKTFNIYGNASLEEAKLICVTYARDEETDFQQIAEVVNMLCQNYLVITESAPYGQKVTASEHPTTQGLQEKWSIMGCNLPKLSKHESFVGLAQVERDGEQLPAPWVSLSGGGVGA